MKKLIALLLAVILGVCCLFGCQPAEVNDDPSADFWKYVNEYRAANTEANGVLTVALSPDFAPMEFCDVSKSGQDSYVGFDVILANYIASELDMKLEIKPMSFDACQAAVSTGSVSMSISGYSYTDNRAENYELSDFYIAGDNETEQVIIVDKANEGKYTTADSFKGMKVGAQVASLQYDLCTKQLPTDEYELKEFVSIDIAVESLIAGTIDALAVAKGNAEAIIANQSKVALSGFEFDVSSDEENNLIIMKKGDTELKEKVNTVLAKALAAKLYGGWYNASKKYAGVSTAKDQGYDESGAPIVEPSEAPAESSEAPAESSEAPAESSEAPAESSVAEISSPVDGYSVVSTDTFFLTHYNDSSVEGAGVVFTTAYTGAAWWNHYQFTPTEDGLYELTAVSLGLGDGSGTPLEIPEGGFVYAYNIGNNWPQLIADGGCTGDGATGLWYDDAKHITLPNYASPAINAMSAIATTWEVGQIFNFEGIDLVTTTIAGENTAMYYEDGYVCDTKVSLMTPELGDI